MKIENLKYIPSQENAFEVAQIIAVGSSNLVKGWRIDTYECTFTINECSNCIVCIPPTHNLLEASLLVLGGQSSNLKVFNVNEKTIMNELEDENIFNMIYIPPYENNDKAPIVSSTSNKGTVNLWNVDTYENVCSINQDYTAQTLVYIPPDQNYLKSLLLVAGTSKGIFTIYNIDAREVVDSYQKVAGQDIKYFALIPSSDNFLKIPIVVSSGCGGNLDFYTITNRSTTSTWKKNELYCMSSFIIFEKWDRVVFAAERKQLKLLSTKDFSEYEIHDENVTQIEKVAIRGKSYVMAAADNMDIVFIDPYRFNQIKRIATKEEIIITSVKLINFKDKIYVICGYYKGKVKVFDFDLEVCVTNFDFHNSRIISLSALVFGSRILFISAEEKSEDVPVFDINGKVVYLPQMDFEEYPQTLSNLSIRGTQYFICQFNNCVKFWKMGYSKQNVTLTGFQNFYLHEANYNNNY